MLLSDPDDDEPTQAIVMDTSSPAVAAGSDDEDKQGDEPTQAWNRSAGQEEGEVDDDDEAPTQAVEASTTASRGEESDTDDQPTQAYSKSAGGVGEESGGEGTGGEGMAGDGRGLE